MKDLCSRYSGQLLFNCQKEQAASAEYQAALQEARSKAQQKYETILQLQNAINTTQDAKAIQELSARIQSEQSTLESSRAQAAYELELAKTQIAQAKQNEAQKLHHHAFEALTDEERANAMRY